MFTNLQPYAIYFLMTEIQIQSQEHHLDPLNQHYTCCYFEGPNDHLIEHI